MTARHQASAFIVCLSAVACVLGVALDAACTPAQQAAASCVTDRIQFDRNAGLDDLATATDVANTCEAEFAAVVNTLRATPRIVALPADAGK